jgi:hypothetical protein
VEATELRTEQRYGMFADNAHNNEKNIPSPISVDTVEGKISFLNRTPITGMSIILYSIDFQKNNFAALSVGNGRKRPIPSLLPCEMNFLKVYTLNDASFIFFPKSCRHLTEKIR